MRSDQQRKGIEVFCRELAEALNDSGFEMKAVLAVKQVDVPWTQDRVKDILWRPIQLALLDKESTTKLEKSEVDQVHQVLSRHLSTHFGVYVPFPSRDLQDEL